MGRYERGVDWLLTGVFDLIKKTSVERERRVVYGGRQEAHPRLVTLVVDVYHRRVD